MSKINVHSSDLKSPCTENKTTVQNLSKRYCGNCNKEYIFKNVIGEYPELFQVPITTLWKDPEIKFYCTYCLLLKLIKSIKKKKINPNYSHPLY